MLNELSICLDGDKWCILHGDNLHDGTAGFGSTLMEAILDFDRECAKEFPKMITK